MTLPPALLARLAQRGLVEKKAINDKIKVTAITENEEVIAEDYDEIDGEDAQDTEEYQNPSQYDDVEYGRKRNEDNFWLECMKARMSEANSVAGYKGCPNKYNIWHKCTLFCVNRWSDGKTEPTREYLRRFKRLIKKYPLPDGWTKIYDPGCGCFYFCNTNDNVVSWLPPTHPKSIISKSAATLRRQLDESAGGDGLSDSSDHDATDNDISDDERECINTNTNTNTNKRNDNNNDKLTRHSRSPPTFHAKDFPSLHDAQQTNGGGVGGGAAAAITRKPKTRKN